MYIIHEYQTDMNGNTAIVPPTTRATLNEAKSVYHQILASAAISSVPYHTAMICYHNGNLIEAECFEHLPDSEPEEATESEA